MSYPCRWFHSLSVDVLPMSIVPQLNNAANRIIYFLQNCTSPNQLFQIQTQIITRNLQYNSTIAHHFVSTCQSFNLLDSALNLFIQSHKPHVFVFNILIRAFSHSHSPHKSIFLYTHMHRNSVSPNNYTFPFLLKSISDLKDIRLGKSTHAQIVNLGLFNDIYVQNSILNMYASCGHMVLCRKVFDEMSYRDVVSWTVLINGNRIAGRLDDALVSFEQMQYAGVVPNHVTMVNALAACAKFGALEMGIWIHDFIKRSGWDLDVVLGTSLVEMYGKCGKIQEGLPVFQSMKEKNVLTWNSLIKGLALAKSGEEAVWWFERMQQEAVKADEVTLLGVLSACAYSGLIPIGRKIFSALINGKYGFPPNAKHYACMIDLLARCGCLEEAFNYIKMMPFEPTESMWGALLAGSRDHANLHLSELAAWKLVELAPENSGYYVLLSNLYAETGRWGEVARVRNLMKERGLKKDLGWSSIEFDSENTVNEILPQNLQHYVDGD
ncbi:Pentatricopeptide repeat [Dillenia turbinata]|uniref:Pentatricopeptide repeat n=1 Tax=Dillenia turbinata TaxID=194707 RepID=A0AAN8W6Q8_9MAGN